MNSAPGRPKPIHPVILSGGVGSRLWPLSREAYPKQLLPLVSERSLLQETARRLSDSADYAPPVIVCNQEHRFVVADELGKAGIAAAEILLEPVGRNTAPAIAVAALKLAERDPDAVLAVQPSDHVIGDVEAFRKAIGRAAALAARGYLVSFGVVPTRAHAGYGYIRRGEPLDGAEGAHRVAAFVEKPRPAAAERYLAEGGYFWNAGIFVFTARTLLAELGRHAPELVARCRRALEDGRPDLGFFRLEPEAFAANDAISLDYALMEKTDRAAMIPLEVGWSDLGSWNALYELEAKDDANSVLVGDVVAVDAADSYVRAEHRLVAALGVENLVIVELPDAVLVADRGRVDEVGQVLERLRAEGREEALDHAVRYRPWGSYQTLEAGPGYQVKRLLVKPGHRLSLQRHRRRSEHWVVVHGTAWVTNGEACFELAANASTYIPSGQVHRLENRGEVPLEVIEVQTGDYLGEDDIERFDDDYNRAGESG